MAKQETGFWKNAMNFGAITGFVIIIYLLLLYFLELTLSQAAGLLQYGFLIGGIILGIKYFRTNSSGGTLTYGRALGMGTAIGLCAAVLLAFYTYLFWKVIDPDAIQKLYVMMEDEMYKQGLPEEQMDMALEMSKKFTTPGTFAIGALIGTTFWSFIISLIVAAFMKKKASGYDAAMEEIKREYNQEQ